MDKPQRASHPMGVRGSVPGPRPWRWKVGEDPRLHAQYLAWNQARAQAQFRDETWEITWPQWREIWNDHWEQRGRRSDSVCLSRLDPRGAWSVANTDIISRQEHCRRQARF